MTIINRNREYLEAQENDAIARHEAKTENWNRDLYGKLIKMAQESIRLHQEMISSDSKLRDRIPKTDLESLELVWNSMNFSQEIIRDLMREIVEYKEVMKHGAC